jgi:hypothetical protein
MTDRVIVEGIVAGPPRYLAWYKRSTRPDGATKTISVWEHVLDDALFQRLQREVQRGDVVEITSVTEWGEGFIRSRLVDFVKVGSAGSEDRISGRVRQAETADQATGPPGID